MRTHVLDINDPGTWRGVVRDIQRVIPFPVRKSAESRDPNRMYCDSMEYLVTAFANHGRNVSLAEIETLGQTVLNSATHLRAYHACKPIELDNYFSEGLQPLTVERLAALAEQYLDGKVLPSIIHKAAEEADLSLREGKIYFGTDAVDLVTNAGHYLIYGPESLCCLFETHGVNSNLKFFNLLESARREKGIPTIFECLVPICWIDEAFRVELGRTIITRYFQRRSKRGYKDWDLDWCFSISRSLPPNLIIGHFHPFEIPDHLRFKMVFKNPFRECDWCKPKL